MWYLTSFLKPCYGWTRRNDVMNSNWSLVVSTEQEQKNSWQSEKMKKIYNKKIKNGSSYKNKNENLCESMSTEIKETFTTDI